MIQANELRIGNWVIDAAKTYGRISSVGSFKCWIDSAEDNLLSDLDPIPLTPDILIAAGFEKVNHVHGYSFFNHDKYKISIYENKTTWMGDYVNNHCKYLHQLQNLIFCLTGTELTITL